MLVLGEEGKTLSKKRARRALEDVCEEYGLAQPPAGEIKKKDFEGILELGFV